MLDAIRRWAGRWPYGPTSTLIGALIATFVGSLLVARVLGPLGTAGGLLSASNLTYAVCGALDTNRPFDLRHAATWFGYAFLHGGIFHILMNSMSIHQLGRLLDALTMPRNVYMSFFAGVLGGAATVELWAALQGSPQPLTVGASAGACGLLGALLALTYKARGGFFGELRKELLSSTILLILIGFLPGISGAGHFGGLLAGGACGWVIRKRGGVRLSNDRWTDIPDAITTLAGATCLAAVLWLSTTAPDDAKLLRTTRPLLDHLISLREWCGPSRAAPTSEQLKDWIDGVDALDVPRAYRPIVAEMSRLAYESGLLDGKPVSTEDAPKMRAAAEALIVRTEAVAFASPWWRR